MQGRAKYNEYIDGGRNARLLEHSVAYRVLIRSYQDSDGDGLGDLVGLTGRLDYIAELGVDVIVLSLYELTHQGDQAKSDDLMSLSTRLGTMLQLIDLISRARERRLKIILSIPASLAEAEVCDYWLKKGVAGFVPYQDPLLSDYRPGGGLNLKKLKRDLVAKARHDTTMIELESETTLRSVTLCAGGRYREEVAKMLATIMLTMPGVPCIYQGQEIGTPSPRQRFGRAELNAGTPMYWSDDEYAGFSEVAPQLALDRTFQIVNVEAQDNDPASVLSYYRQLIALRKSSLILQDGAIKFIGDRGGILCYRRSLDGCQLQVTGNLSSRYVAPAAEIAKGELVCSSYIGRGDLAKPLAPYEAVVTRVD